MLSDDLRALRGDFVEMLDRSGTIRMDFDEGLLLVRVLRQLEEDAYNLQYSLSTARGDHLPPIREGGNVVLLRPRKPFPGRNPIAPKPRTRKKGDL